IMRILIVDDTEASLEIISAMALSMGHEVIKATNGMEAVKSAIESRPHLVLMDMRLPGVDGMQAAAAIRNISPLVGLPIVMMSSHHQEPSAEPQRHWDGFLKKPPNYEALSEVIDRFSQ